jgi:hypothetical protein
MGWFWSDAPATAAHPVAPHPMPRDASLSPPVSRSLPRGLQAFAFRLTAA